VAYKILTVEQFVSDVADHKLSVKLRDGLYRHLVLREPGTSNLWFEVVTWPGSLAIHGDMGTWTFSRVEDMFTFFRSKELKINAQYWCEKVGAESRFGGPSEKFNAEVFKQNVIDSLNGYDLEDFQKAEIVGDLDQDVFCEEDEVSVRRALADFSHDGFTFSDSWEISGNAYTYHFLWCLHAIVWAIQQYDAEEKARGK
jgi:hypothetical protein